MPSSFSNLVILGRFATMGTFTVFLLSILVSVLPINGQPLNFWSRIGDRVGITTVAIDPNDPNIIYGGAYSGPVSSPNWPLGVYKTRNNGESWTLFNAGIENMRISKLAIHPLAPNILYATTYLGGSGIFRSIDGGERWTRIFNFGFVVGLEIAPSNPNIIYAVGSELFVSTDGGASWKSRPTPNNWGGHQLAVHPQDPDIIFTAVCEYYDEENCNDIVYRSLNGGLVWEPGFDVSDSTHFIKFDLLDPNTVYAGGGTYSQAPGIYKTTDLGATWQFIPTPDSITGIEIDPRDPRTFYAVAHNYRAAKSTDRGATWSPYNSGLDHAGDQAGVIELTFDPSGRFLYAATSIGVYRVRVREQLTRSKCDFDGDGRSDISLFRPTTAVWHLLRSTHGYFGIAFGDPSDKLTPADFDGDGRTDIAVFRDGVWWRIKSSDWTVGVVAFGQAGDRVVPADFTGDGRDEVAVYRDGEWWSLDLTNERITVDNFGTVADVPVVADYDGDGRSDQAVYRDGEWHLNRSSQGYTVVNFGLASDWPVVGDYDGDGRGEPAVYRDGTWYILGSMVGFMTFPFGIESDIPVPADYDGDGKTDAAVYRKGIWYVQRSTGGVWIRQFGLADDRPITAAGLPL